jgi:hypothetical protein
MLFFARRILGAGGAVSFFNADGLFSFCSSPKVCTPFKLIDRSLTEFSASLILRQAAG